jgi:MFS family permease
MKWRVLWLMTGTQAGASVVQQALGSLSPALVATFGLTKAQLGIVFTSMMLGSALFVAVAGLLVDRWGERRVVLGAGVCMALALVIPLVAPTYAGLVAGIGLFGAVYASATPAGGRAILTWFDRDRGFAMGIRQTGVPIGGTVGALTLPPLAHAFGLRAAFLYGALGALVPAVVAYVTLPGGAGDRGTPHSVATLVRGMRTLASDRRLIGVALTCMTLVSIQQALNAFFTVTAVSVVGTSATVAAFALALAQCAAAGGRLWWGYASDRIFGGDRMVPFALICAISGLTAAWVGFLGHGAVVALFVAAAVLGLTGVGWNGLMAAALAEIGGAERAASALGLALTVVFTASTIAPVGFGTIADRFSLRAAWLVIAAVALLGMGPALWLRTESAKRGAARKG